MLSKISQFIERRLHAFVKWQLRHILINMAIRLQKFKNRYRARMLDDWTSKCNFSTHLQKAELEIFRAIEHLED